MKIPFFTFQNYNDIQLLFTNDWPPYLFIIAAIALFASICFHWKGISSCSTGTKISLTLLRLCMIFLLVVTFLKPSIIFKRIEKIRNRIVVLFDRSDSMMVPTDKGKTSEEKAYRFLFAEGGLRASWQDSHEVEFYQFSDRVDKIAVKNEHTSEKKKVLGGNATGIVKALEEVIKKSETDDIPIDAIVVISDATENLLFSEDLLAMSYDEVLKNIPSNFSSGNVPVTTIWTGIDENYTDLFVAKTLANEFGFVKNPFTITAGIVAAGYTDIVVPVILKEGDRIIMTKTIAIKTGQKSYPVEFTFVPHETGNHLYTVSVPLISGENIKGNNEKNIAVNIIRDRIRVMLVMGSPSWDGKFLRRYFKEDPSVDLITFIILRTNKNLFNIPTRDLSLIPFPTDELFRKDKELYKFDLIVFLNFDFKAFIPYQYLSDIEQFVTKKGGGFLMIGGRKSFRAGGYGGTPIENILPVRLGYALPGPLETPYIEEDYNLSVTDTGKYNPLFVPKMIDMFNDDLLLLTGLNTSLHPKKDSVVLAEHPSQKNKYGKYPVIAYREAGEGRTMMIASDGSWRWNFLTRQKGENNPYYRSFYNNVVKWLTKDPSFKRITINPLSLPEKTGEKVTFEIKVANGRYQPTWALDLAGVITSPDRKNSRVRFRRTEEKGTYKVFYTPTLSGTYKLEVKTEGKSSKEEIGIALFSIGMQERETQYLALNGNVLKAISEVSKGKFYTLDELSDNQLVLDLPKRYKTIDESFIVLWNHAALLGAFLILLSIEWFLRRRSGLR